MTDKTPRPEKPDKYAGYAAFYPLFRELVSAVPSSDGTPVAIWG